MHRILFAALLLSLAAAPAVAADTAHASGTLVVRAGPGDYYPAIGRLMKNERVAVESCTRQSRWCLIDQLNGRLSGWVPGSYLVGSAAKNAVTPFQFSFDPMDPLGLYRHRW